jgi:ketosteroid isomerase-like protein
MSTRIFLASMIVLLTASGCTNADQVADKSAEAIKEINEAEKSFAKMSAEKGIAEAFWYYADDNATIRRENDTLIHGKDQIRQYYSASFYKTAKVDWSPDFTSASASGDMGYTYGKYIWQSTDSTGNISEYKGIFHTVWKKQSDGSWKYVWD